MIDIFMKQIIFIHGWNRFPNNEALCKELENREYSPFEEKKKRKERLTDELKWKYEIFKPEMPNKFNASYMVRKLRFEKVLVFINNEELVLIWHSLWWQFLLKYIWENWFPKKIKQLHLVSTVVDASDRTPEKQYQWDFEFDLNIIPNLEKHCDQIFIYHSTDDKEVPYSHAEKIKSYLPNAKLITLTDRWHLYNKETFPEILENILIS